MFISEVIQWNKDCFANIFCKKKRLLACLGGIQSALEDYDSISLHHLEWKLRRELEEVLNHEELLWLQKSQKEWLSSGDRNTTFFHWKTITRRKKNQITVIQDVTGHWLYNSDDITKHTVEFFSSLYTLDTVALIIMPSWAVSLLLMQICFICCKLL